MVEHPDPEPASTPATDATMPDATARAFRSHYEMQLQPSGKIGTTIDEIERVFDRRNDAAVAVSGGKDSMTTLALAAAADCRHRAFHYDWGERLIPRDVERAIVERIRGLVADERFLVAGRGAPTVRSWPDADRVRTAIANGDRYDDPDGSLNTLAGILGRSDRVGMQVVGLRREESGKRDRKLDGLYGESLGQPAAFPLREWSARDVWAYIVAEDVPYPDHYDRLAETIDGGSPAAYEQARFTTFHDPEFEIMGGAAMGLAAWDHHNIEIN